MGSIWSSSVAGPRSEFIRSLAAWEAWSFHLPLLCSLWILYSRLAFWVQPHDIVVFGSPLGRSPTRTAWNTFSASIALQIPNYPSRVGSCMISSRQAVPGPNVMYVMTSIFTSEMLLLAFYAFFFFCILTNLKEMFIYCLLNCEPLEDEECDLSLSILYPDNKGPTHKRYFMNM